ncbi:MAG: MATE family efflux transporter [Tissierellia bacterium]|nr:MATE family efflux transporter [Tissierellia bacterium]
MHKIKTHNFSNKFTLDKEFYKIMLKLSLPIMIQNLISSLINMVDTIMVGKLGEVEIAAVGIANQYFFLFNMILVGLCGGCSVFFSQFWGKKDTESINKVVGMGLVSVALFSIIFMIGGFIFPEKIISLFNKDPLVIDFGARYLSIVAISYIFTGITFVYSYALRSTGNTVQPLVVSIVSLLINVFFNYMLIFGKFGAPALGVSGAAVATVIARVAETIILIFLIYKSKDVLAASIKELTDFNFEFVKKSYKVIFPVILNDICWGLASLVYAAVYGRIGTQAVAAVQICNTVNNLFMVVGYGLSSSSAIMIGNSIGEGKEHQGVDYAKKFMIISIVTSVFLGLLLSISSPLILNMFNISTEVRSSAQAILYIISFIFFIRISGLVIIVGILRGGGDASSAFIIEGFTMWFIGVPLMIIGAFVFKFPVHIVYALAIFEELAKCILGLMRIKSGKWIKNLTA